MSASCMSCIINRDGEFKNTEGHIIRMDVSVHICVVYNPKHV